MGMAAMKSEPFISIKWWGYILIAALVFVFLFIPIIELFQIKKLYLFGSQDRGINNFYSACLIFLTFTLVIVTGALARVAWIQLAKIQSTAQADFLLRIDDRYGSPSIIKARAIIHRLYIATDKNICKDKRDEILASKIKELYENLKFHKDFIHLLNFLDFLETIAYFSNQGYVEVKEINELLGGSLEYFHKIFTPLVGHLRYHYRDDLSNPSYYRELDKLVDKIKSINKTI